MGLGIPLSLVLFKIKGGQAGVAKHALMSDKAMTPGLYISLHEMKTIYPEFSVGKQQGHHIPIFVADTYVELPAGCNIGPGSLLL